VKHVRRLVVAVIGGTVVVIGVAMIVLPGPAIVVIPAGLAILATEFVWARRLLQRVKERSATLVSSVRGSGSDRGGEGKNREDEPSRER
jgi:tellurite resistance protein TerC